MFRVLKYVLCVFVFSMNVMADVDFKKINSSKEDVIKVFNILAFGADYSVHLSRWEQGGALEFAVVSTDIDAMPSDFYANVFNVTEKISGHQHIYNQSEISNIFMLSTSTPVYDALVKYEEELSIFFESRDDFLKKIRNVEKYGEKVVLSQVFGDPSNKILATLLILPVDESSIKLYLGESIMYLYGFNRFDSKDFINELSQTSMSNKLFINEKEFNEVLTPLDKLLLTILYDDRLKSGMTFEKAQPILKEIVNEFNL